MKNEFIQSMTHHCLHGTLMALILLASTAVVADSKRIVVYPLSQNYVDTREGDTLGEIVDHLLPDNTHLQQKLMEEIMQLNPNAFIEHDPDRLLANVRLFLPDHFHHPDSEADLSKYRVESYSWGNIKRPR